jgi:hypothetical protein
VIVQDADGHGLVLASKYMGRERRRQEELMTDTGDNPVRRTETRVILSKDTLVPITAVLAFAGLMFTGFRWLDARFASVELQERTHHEEVTTELQAIKHHEELVDLRYADRWTVTEMRLWVLEAKVANPHVMFPDVRAREER